MNLYGLNLLNEGYFEGYDPNCNAGIFNEFSTAAYRFGHSLVRPFFPRVDTSFAEKQPILMRQSFFNSEMLMEFQAIDEVMRGMFISPMEGLDQFITGEITNHLFETRSIPFSGFDLASLNIQRGRDHGLRPYNEYRAACNLKRAVNFEDLSREMTSTIIERLKQVYTSVDDIDLWTGGLVETPLQGGLVGPTFGCIIGNQFRAPLSVCLKVTLPVCQSPVMTLALSVIHHVSCVSARCRTSRAVGGLSGTLALYNMQIITCKLPTHVCDDISVSMQMQQPIRRVCVC